MFGVLSILMIPVILVITGGSAILISKLGGKKASKKVQELNGVYPEDVKEEK